jgi:hypothetical protein
MGLIYSLKKTKQMSRSAKNEENHKERMETIDSNKVHSVRRNHYIALEALAKMKAIEAESIMITIKKESKLIHKKKI